MLPTTRLQSAVSFLNTKSASYGAVAFTTMVTMSAFPTSFKTSETPRKALKLPGKALKTPGPCAETPKIPAFAQNFALPTLKLSLIW